MFGRAPYYVGRTAKLETLDYCDGCYGIAHTPLIELAGGHVCGVKFQICELGTLPAPPVFSRSQQEATDTLIAVTAAYRDLRNMAVDYFSVLWIRRLFESCVYESDDLSSDLAGVARRTVPTCLEL